VVSRNTTLVPSLGLHIGPACEAGLSAGMRRERVSPQIRKKEERHLAELKQILLLKWRKLDHSIVVAAISQWCRHLSACVRVHGGHSEHILWCFHVFSVLSQC